MRPDLLAAWQAYDAAARALPGCAHNRAWRALGPGRGATPDCPHNRVHRAEVAAAWQAYLAVLDAAVAGRGSPDEALIRVGARGVMDELW